MYNWLKRYKRNIFIIIMSGFIALYLTCFINEFTLTTNLQRGFIYTYFVVMIFICFAFFFKKIRKLSCGFKSNQMISILFGALVLCIISGNFLMPQIHLPNNIIISIPEESNQDSQGKEVWISGIRVGGVSKDITQYADDNSGWVYKENALYGNAVESKPLTLPFEKAQKIEISFVMHKWSGNVIIENDQFLNTFDLYDLNGSSIKVNVPVAVKNYSTWIYWGLKGGQFFSYFIILFLLFYLFFKRKKQYTNKKLTKETVITYLQHAKAAPQTSSPNRIDYLDGLRAMCALIVLCNHFAALFFPWIYDYGIFSKSPLYFFINGENAVIIFFCISSYLLGYRYFFYKDTRLFISTFFKRYIRLVLPCLFSILMSYLFMKFSFMYANALNTNYTIWDFQPSFKEAISEGVWGIFIGKPSKYNVALWTIMYEIKGPLLVIAILSIFGSYKKRSIIYILCLIYFNNSYLLAFITGIIISDFSVNCHFIKKKFCTKIISTIVFFTGIILSMYPVIINNFTGIYHIMQKISDDKTLYWRLIGSSMIFFGIININFIQTLLKTKFLTHIGKLSFSIYVIHLSILGSFSSMFCIFLMEYFSYQISASISILTSCIIIYAAARFIHKCIDVKGIKLSNIIYTKYFN